VAHGVCSNIAVFEGGRNRVAWAFLRRRATLNYLRVDFCVTTWPCHPHTVTLK
jgi:hypothetical protein